MSPWTSTWIGDWNVDYLVVIQLFQQKSIPSGQMKSFLHPPLDFLSENNGGIFPSQKKPTEFWGPKSLGSCRSRRVGSKHSTDVNSSPSTPFPASQTEKKKPLRCFDVSGIIGNLFGKIYEDQMDQNLKMYSTRCFPCGNEDFFHCHVLVYWEFDWFWNPGSIV